jgi:hypothetical protein
MNKILLQRHPPFPFDLAAAISSNPAPHFQRIVTHV